LSHAVCPLKSDSSRARQSGAMVLRNKDKKNVDIGQDGIMVVLGWISTAEPRALIIR
jgi:hypothetical protein